MAEAAPKAFVAGWPIAHSRSPLIHGTWLERFGLSGTYERAAVAPEDLARFVRGMRAAGYVGGNVTIPHKEAVFALIDRRDAAAEAIGAVNTLWFEGDALVGGNTDAYGFAANLDEHLAGWRDAGSALVLGAGGAARAVVYALKQAGIPRVCLVNRTLRRAQAIADAFGQDSQVGVEAFADADQSALLAQADLVVNTRPPSSLAPDLEGLAAHALVTDIVYVPLETPILAAARARGHRTADGLGMLLHQAVPGFERWFNRRPVVDGALRDRLVADIAASA